jgi:hypothetical protein
VSLFGEAVSARLCRGRRLPSSTRGAERLLLRSLSLAAESLLPLHIFSPLGELQLSVEDLSVRPEVAWRHVKIFDEWTMRRGGRERVSKAEGEEGKQGGGREGGRGKEGKDLLSMSWCRIMISVKVASSMS